MAKCIRWKIDLLVLVSVIMLGGCSTSENGWSPRVPTVADPELITGPGTAPSVSGKELFITVKVMTTNDPSKTWLQFSKWNYSGKKACQDVIRKNYEGIEKAAAAGLGNEFRSMQGARCMTFKEAADLNSELGH